MAFAFTASTWAVSAFASVGSTAFGFSPRTGGDFTGYGYVSRQDDGGEAETIY